MMMPSMWKKVVCFDLDDTLYKEIDYLQSAFREIASFVGHPEIVPQMMRWYRDGKNVFLELNKVICKRTDISQFFSIYRNHYPTISLSEGVEVTLNELKYRGVTLGLITDGRSVSQRNKIKALGLNRWFESDNIIISEEFGSEKTNPKNFYYFVERFPAANFAYVGDNPRKDFIVPNMLMWDTFMLKDDGRNIHKQNNAHKFYTPQTTISEIEELLYYVK